MNRTYIYPRINIVALIASPMLIWFSAIIAKAFLIEAEGSKNLVPMLVAAIIGLVFAFCAASILVIQFINLLALKKVITHDEDVTIQNLFSSKTIRWGDITEFGTYTTGFGYQVRHFYLKSTQFGDEKIEVCTHQLDHLKDLIDTIFRRAKNAKFISIENVAWIPFTKQLEVFAWDKNDQSFMTWWRS